MKIVVLDQDMKQQGYDHAVAMALTALSSKYQIQPDEDGVTVSVSRIASDPVTGTSGSYVVDFNVEEK